MVGIHTAVVIGPDGQEIFTDKYGRIQVRFVWDHRQDAKPQQDICWVRVIQPWSGSETGSDWGWHHLPRIGTEVAVSFMDGDPDRPVVVGCFYNGVSMPLFDLSGRDSWTKSGFRSRSATSAAKGGGSNFSEFSFDDKTGSELVFLHAEKDLQTEVENNQTLKVDNCRSVTVTKNETIDIGKAQTVTIGAGRSVTVKDKDDTLTISTGNLTVTTSLGNISAKADAGAVTIEAMQSITLKCGQSTLTIDPTGITLEGMMMTIKGDVTVSLEGLTTTVKGDAMLTLKGAIMMLN
jgi:type VI secretion system secreted protein VgrG